MVERGALGEAIRFWEFARIPYNLVLAAVTVFMAFALLSEGAVSYADALSAIPLLVVLAIVANLLYCAAYPLDLIAQATPLRTVMNPARWVLWSAGTLTALLLAGALVFGFTAWPD